jgi:hypothetical protein
MTTLKASPNEIREALMHCTGSEHWYRHPLARACLYTDGAKLFAEMAGAYWFLDIVATEILPLQRREEFILVVLAVCDGRARITAEDGNCNAFWSRHIEFTDCPEGTWMFYLVNNTILVPSEY